MCEALLLEMGDAGTDTSKWWGTWGAAGWQRRAPGSRACFQDDSRFWENALSGKDCGRNWYEGASSQFGGWGARVSYPKHQAPAVLGYDESIFAWCCRVLGNRDVSGGGCGFHIGENTRLADTCIAASQSVLRLMNGWNLCRNTEWVMCALHGRLPGQNTRAIRFAKAPKSLVIEEFWRPPAGCVNGACDSKHYAVSDVFYVEACLISSVCRNRERLFASLGVGEDFACDFDAEAYERLQESAKRTTRASRSNW